MLVKFISIMVSFRYRLIHNCLNYQLNLEYFDLKKVNKKEFNDEMILNVN